MIEFLDEVFVKKYDEKNMIEVVEGKLFGMGIEFYMVGFYLFYNNYVISWGKFWMIDVGYWYLMEDVLDKFFVFMLFGKGLMLYVLCLICWDSDYVVIFDEVL